MEESAGRHDYICTTWGKRLVAEYTGLDFHQIGQLDYGSYLLYLRDAYITRLNSTEEGRQFLDDCWRMRQEKPDRGKLRKFTSEG